MKKFLIILLVLCLCFTLTSCGIERNPSILLDFGILFGNSGLPEYSENFDEEFFEMYERNFSYAPNLAYYSASEWEAEQENGNTNHRFSLINGVDKDRFVAVSLAYRNPSDKSDFIGSVNVYRHNNAPDPIKDWTVKSVSFIAVDSNTQPNRTFCESETDTNLLGYNNTEPPITLESLSVNYMSLFDTAESRICSFDRESSPDLIAAVAEACKSTQTVTDFVQMTVRNRSDVFEEQIYIVVSFEESDNIVWYTTLSTNSDGTEIYIDITTGGVQKGVIDGEYAALIRSKVCPE